MIWLALRSPVNGGCQSDKGASVSWEPLSFSLSLSVHFPRESQISCVQRGCSQHSPPKRAPLSACQSHSWCSTHTLREGPRTLVVHESAHMFNAAWPFFFCFFFVKIKSICTLWITHALYYSHILSSCYIDTDAWQNSLGLFSIWAGVWGDCSPQVRLARMAWAEATGLSGSLWVPGGLLWRVSSPESITVQFLTHSVKHLNWNVDVLITNSLNGKNVYFHIFFKNILFKYIWQCIFLTPWS